jgi:pimeloyl-ACP methyl ester carboxylesterase
MKEFEYQLPQSLLTIRGYQSGPEHGPLVLALHGWLDNCYSFRRLAQVCPELRFLAIDLPGHGDSDWIPAGMGYDFHFYGLWVHELITSWSLQPFHLLGHSMGAAIASLYAGAFPEKLRSLILIEGIGPQSLPEDEAPQKLGAYYDAWLQSSRIRNTLYGSWEEAVRARTRGGELDAGSAEILAQRSVSLNEKGALWKHDPRLKLPSRYQYSEAQVLAYLRRISCPVLGILGNQSDLATHPVAMSRLAAIPHIREERLSGGHHLHMEHPEVVATLIRDVIRTCELS